jgi:chromate transporter
VFGGGHVVLPLLDAGVVTPGYVSSGSFVAGYGFAQAMPGPLFSFGAYIGAVSTSGPGGVAGAIIGTVALLLPGALLILAALPVLGAARSRPQLAAALRGVNAVVVGILAAALVTPVATSGVTSLATATVAVVGALALLSGRLPPLVVVAGSCLALAALAAIGVT